MNIKELIQKALKGETLTAEETTALEGFDPQKQTDSAAAAARKEAESKVAKAAEEKAELEKKMQEYQQMLEEKDNAGKSELEKAQAQIAELSKNYKTMTESLEAERKQAQQMKRAQSINEIRRKAGIQFADGLDHTMLQRHFENAFEGLDNLDDDTIIKTKIDTFKTMNSAAIVDNSGHGSGTQKGANPTPTSKAPAENAADREKELREAGIL